MQYDSDSIYESRKKQAPGPQAAVITPLDLRQAIETEPAPLDYVLPGFLSGTVGALVAPGSAGKSWLAIEIATAIAGGHDLTDGALTTREGHTGRVLYLPAEDPPEVLAHRAHALGEHLGESVREALYERLTVLPMIGRAPCLLGGDADASWVRWLQDQACGHRLLILDTLRRFHNSDENSAGEMAALMRVLESVAESTGCAILYLHHISKGSALGGLGDEQQAARGSSVLVDNARWQAALVGMSPDDAKQLQLADADRRAYVRLCFPKINYGPPQPDVWLARGAGGVLVPAPEIGERQAKARLAAEAAEAGRVAYLDSRRGSRGRDND